MARRSDTADRLPLTRERILSAAVDFADEHGVAALTMRKLADRMGVGAMSLYTHVANKDEMLEGMVELVSADIQLPVVGDDWQASMRAGATSAQKVLIAHPWACAEWTQRIPGPARFAFMDAILQVLTAADLGDSLVYRGYHAITMHIVGFTSQQLSYRQVLSSGQDLADVAGPVVGQLEAAGLHHLSTHVQAHLDGDDHGDEFVFVLDLIMDGLERARSAD